MSDTVKTECFYGVGNGIRTRDIRNHNPAAPTSHDIPQCSGIYLTGEQTEEVCREREQKGDTHPEYSISAWMADLKANGQSLISHSEAPPILDPVPDWSDEEVRHFVKRMHRACPVRASSWVVYFVADEYGCVKIGTTSNLPRRFKEIQKSASLQCTLEPENVTLVGAFPGDREAERFLHNEFRAYRTECEWFRIVPHLVLAINALIVPAGYPPFARLNFPTEARP